MFRVIFIMIVLPFIWSGNKYIAKNSRIYLAAPYLPDKEYKTSKLQLNFHDSLPDNTLTLFFSDNSDPIFFSRDIYTGVCFDTLCRPISITLYWEIFGKYLGYSITSGNELTKKEHVTFSENDYLKLNEILGDSSSALGFYAMDKISAPKKSIEKVDGISGATVHDLGPWIVPEAAYTSFKLWQITYGATRDSIIAYTKKNLFSYQLVINNLQSNDAFNQIKAMQWISEIKPFNNQFVGQVLNILRKGIFLQSRQALKCLQNSSMSEEVLQKEMIQLFGNEDYRIKNLVLEYLKSCEKLAQSAARDMICLLKSDDYYTVNVTLALFTKKYQPDYADQLKIINLLKSDNFNVSNRVYNYLIDLPGKSSDISKILYRYRKVDLK